MIRIHRVITNEDGEMYRLYIKRYAMTDGFSFGVTLYKTFDFRDKLYTIDRLTATNNSFGTHIKSKGELEKYEQILWLEVYKDIKKNIEDSLIVYDTFNLNNESYIEREKTVLKEIGKILRKQKLERIIK